MELQKIYENYILEVDELVNNKIDINEEVVLINTNEDGLDNTLLEYAIVSGL